MGGCYEATLPASTEFFLTLPASRMESHGEPGMIMITEATAELLPESFNVVSQGMREIKGKGPMPVFSVEAFDQ